jgi:UDP-GlcNAc:undecaprenyl-phosphate/decaprenyl-phosphate GlcNAc-1-phosphate transferase
MTLVIFAAVLAFAASFGLTVVVKRLALRVGAVAVPVADRWHRGRVPLLGGLAIGVAVLAVAAVVPIRDVSMLWLLAGATVMMAVGTIDDIRPLKPQSKLVVQILVAAALAGLGLQLRLTGYAALDVVITLVWIVGISNALNLLDNMDGLAAGIAAISAGFRVIFLLADGNVEGAALAAAVVGASAGFLVHNFNPASIFMGDAGSLFLGVMVAGLSLVGGWPYSRNVASVLLLPVLMLLVPIVDTMLVTVTRTLAGRPVSMGGRDHTSHRLVALGLSERSAVLLLYLLAVLSGVVALGSYRYGLSQMVVIVMFLAMAATLFGIFLGRLEVYPAKEAGAPDRSRFISLIADFSYTRQVAAVIIDTVLIVTSYYAAYLLRFEQQAPRELHLFVQSLPILIGCQLTAFGFYRLYQGSWRHTSVRDFLQLVQAATAGTGLAVVVLVLVYRFEGYSRALFVLDWMLVIGSAGAARLSFRALGEALRPPSPAGTRVLIYGAGDAGVMLLRELRNNPGLDRQVVAFVDDDRSKHRTLIQRLPVAGGLDQLPQIVESTGATQVIVSSHKVPDARLQDLSNVCNALGLSMMRASLRIE